MVFRVNRWPGMLDKAPLASHNEAGPCDDLMLRVLMGLGSLHNNTTGLGLWTSSGHLGCRAAVRVEAIPNFLVNGRFAVWCSALPITTSP